jgi:hypothetical protein
MDRVTKGRLVVDAIERLARAHHMQSKAIPWLNCCCCADITRRLIETGIVDDIIDGTHTSNEPERLKPAFPCENKR